MISDAYVIRLMAIPDLGEIVEIHLKSFPGFFLSFLGRDFLTLLYRSIFEDHEGIVLVASSEGRIQGFVAGVMHQKGFYQRLLRRNKWAFAIATLGALLKRPTIAPRLIRALRKPNEARQASAEACLMSVAVRPEMEGKGIGQQLVQAFCRTSSERGGQAVCLTTDCDNNERVKRFYQGLGFRISRSFTTPEGRAMVEYLMSLGKLE